MGAKAILVDALYFSKLAFQSLGLVTQSAIKRQKAKATFKKTLISQGVPLEAADEIAKDYPNPLTEIFSLIRSSTRS